MKSLTKGTVLAMGDMRAIATACGGTHTLVQIEAQACTGDVPANAPFTDHVAQRAAQISLTQMQIEQMKKKTFKNPT